MPDKVDDKTRREWLKQLAKFNAEMRKAAPGMIKRMRKRAALTALLSKLRVFG